MKFQSHKLLVCCLAFSSLNGAYGDDNSSNIVPSGFLKAADSIVREGLPVRLDWEVTLPPTGIDELVPEDPEKEIIPTADVLAEVRVLGSAVGSSDNPYWVEASMRGSKGGWRSIFKGYGTGVGMDSSEVFEVEEGEELEFSSVTWNRSQPSFGPGRGHWIMRNPVETGTSDDRLLLLRDGDTVPSFNPAFDQAEIAAFLAPYIEDDGVTLKLGPRDILMLTELNNVVDSTADFQDMVVLVTFTKVEVD